MRSLEGRFNFQHLHPDAPQQSTRRGKRRCLSGSCAAAALGVSAFTAVLRRACEAKCWCHRHGQRVTGPDQLTDWSQPMRARSIADQRISLTRVAQSRIKKIPVTTEYLNSIDSRRGFVDRTSRLILLALVMVWAVWRLVRYLRLGMQRRPAGIAGGAGLLVPAAATAQVGDGAGMEGGSRSGVRRLLGFVTGFAFWIVCNALAVFLLFGRPLFPDAPALILMVVAVVPNFYLIPLARRIAERWP
jgi:hypothetical protein